MRIETFVSSDEFAQASVSEVLKGCSDSSSDICSLALAGGSTPRPIYEMLGSVLDFSAVRLYQLDERYVSSGDKDSNARMINEAFFGEGESDIFFSFDTSLSLEQCVADYDVLIDDVVFDVAIVGVGTDGHIASLFPGSDALLSRARVASSETDVFAVRSRLTLTIPTILSSRKIVILLQGEGKQVVIDHLNARDVTVDEFPVMALVDHPHLVVHHLQ